jgi:hypothetical protein
VVGLAKCRGRRVMQESAERAAAEAARHAVISLNAVTASYARLGF